MGASVGSCIEWTGSKDRKGYGRRSAGAGRSGRPKKGESAPKPLYSTQLRHRQTVEQVGHDMNGRRYEDFPQVNHLCNNPACYRYDHLVMATAKENSEHMTAQGRHTADGSDAIAARRQKTLNKPCPKCGGERQLMGQTKKRVRCPKHECRGGQ